MPPIPSGLSTLRLGPATKPSSDIAILKRSFDKVLSLRRHSLFTTRDTGVIRRVVATSFSRPPHFFRIRTKRARSQHAGRSIAVHSVLCGDDARRRDAELHPTLECAQHA